MEYTADEVKIKKFKKNRAIAIIVSICLILCAALIIYIFETIKEPTFSLSNETVLQNQIADVNLSLKNNTGIMTASVTITFDNDKLKLIKITDMSLLDGYSSPVSYDSPCVLTWDGTEETKCNGILASLSFQVLEGFTEGTESIDITYDNGSILDFEAKPVECKTTGGSISVEICEHKNCDWFVITEATDSQKGEEQLICLDCSAILETRELPVTSHKFSVWKTVREPTCTEYGIEERKCNDCDEVQRRILDPLGHDSGKWIIVEKSTENKSGRTELRCMRCDTVLQSKQIPAGSGSVNPVDSGSSQSSSKPTASSTESETSPAQSTGSSTHSTVSGTASYETVTGGRISAEPVTISKGEAFEVEVKLTENPGLTSAIIEVSYDTSKLKLVKATDTGVLNGATFDTKNYSKSPYSLAWFDALTTVSNTDNGVIAVLEFEALSDFASGSTNISFSSTEGNTLDADMNDIALTFEACKVTVK